MTPSKHKEIDIPDFLNKPQEARVTIAESILQESIRHEYYKGINTGWMCGLLTGSFITFIILAVLVTLNII